MSKRITVYSATELKRKNPDAFEKAHQRFNNDYGEIPWSGEIIDSLKAIFKASGIALRDYSIEADYPSQSWIRFDMESDTESLGGNRAMAWLENNLLADLRIPFTGAKRWELSKYGMYYRAGMVETCPFTGYCADDDFIQSLITDIKAGETVGEAYHNLATLAGKMFESEMKYQNSEENFLEQDYQFTIDGRIV